MNDWNAAIIEEFRANNGQVGGMFEGRTLLLLHHTGARTGTRRVTPLAYQDLADGYAVFASKAGADTNPDWYHNVVANPATEVEVGTGTIRVRARVASGAERDRIWTRQKQDYPQFEEYESKTSRVIPVIVLERA
ncbi:MAG: nitroreductase family deazaflavin-dependent oxidoreductase [bacterium]|nr:nitroreductase family deazaflavin-dependent oxidoreductase [bacterium]MDE0351796.1 nitroreductase family deazaflavin-dependent oxidoreductase [bacterium]